MSKFTVQANTSSPSAEEIIRFAAQATLSSSLETIRLSLNLQWHRLFPDNYTDVGFMEYQLERMPRAWANRIFLEGHRKMAGIKPHITGLDQIAPIGANERVVCLGTHPLTLAQPIETYILTNYLTERVIYVAKLAHRAVPGFGQALEASRSVLFINRKNPAAARRSIRTELAAKFDPGSTVVIYPGSSRRKMSGILADQKKFDQPDKIPGCKKWLKHTRAFRYNGVYEILQSCRKIDRQPRVLFTVGAFPVFVDDNSPLIIPTPEQVNRVIGLPYHFHVIDITDQIPQEPTRTAAFMNKLCLLTNIWMDELRGTNRVNSKLKQAHLDDVRQVFPQISTR